jgi:PAS domain S-box-containing protein
LRDYGGGELSFLAGGGEAGTRIRAHDWTNSPLGAPEAWSQSLRTAVRLMLNTRHPIFIFWGNEHICLFNDAYGQSMGLERRENALGRPARQVWAEIWDVIGPQIEQVMSGRGATWHENHLIPITRDGALAEVYWTYSYSPIDDEGAANRVGGVLVIVTETTQTVLAEKRAAAERARLSHLFERTPTFMAMLQGPDHTIEYANPGYMRLVGHRPIIGKTVAEALPDAVAQGYLDLLDGVFRSGKAFSASGSKYAVQAEPDGPVAERFVDFVYQPITDAQGEVTGIFLEGVDVTERVLAAQAVQESEERLQVALSVGQGVGTWDWNIPNDRVVADDRFAKLYGVEPELAKGGAPISEFFAHIHPDDAPRIRTVISELLKTGGEFREEYRLLQPDGSNRWVVAQGRCVLAADGTPSRFPGLTFDITERKLAEERNNALLELDNRFQSLENPADLAYAAAEILGRTLGVSRAGYGTVDLAEETITIERDWNAPGIKTIAGVLRFRDYGTYIEDLKRGETVIFTDAHTDPRTAKGAQSLTAISARAAINMPVTEHEGFVALLYLNHADAREWPEDELIFVREVAQRTRMVVERRRAEQELRDLAVSLESQVAARTAELMEAEASLRQAQKMEAVGHLTGGIAHDFNNLLAGILGSLELLDKRIAQGRMTGVERYISGAQESARRAASLTQRLLAFARRQTLDPKPTDVNRLVSGMEELIRRTMGPDVFVEVVGAGGLWPIKIDPSQLENSLLNLCINARDAMAPHGGRLTIETANKWLDERSARMRDLPPGQYISLCVTDTGSGMTPDIIARAFDPFFTTKPLGQGTGLGLSMVYGFARQSGGQVRIYSEVAKGTTLCLYLPRHMGAEETAEPEEQLVADHGAGETVLVIDDEDIVRMLIVEVLQESGYRAIEAVDGPTGLKILQSDVRVDLLITDVGLPSGMNGRQVADAARVTRPGLKVLFITGYAENAAVGNGDLDAGMEVLTKPFAMAALGSKVRELIER